MKRSIKLLLGLLLILSLVACSSNKTTQQTNEETIIESKEETKIEKETVLEETKEEELSKGDQFVKDNIDAYIAGNADFNNFEIPECISLEGMNEWYQKFYIGSEQQKTDQANGDVDFLYRLSDDKEKVKLMEIGQRRVAIISNGNLEFTINGVSSNEGLFEYSEDASSWKIPASTPVAIIRIPNKFFGEIVIEEPIAKQAFHQEIKLAEKVDISKVDESKLVEFIGNFYLDLAKYMKEDGGSFENVAKHFEEGSDVEAILSQIKADDLLSTVMKSNFRIEKIDIKNNTYSFNDGLRVEARVDFLGDGKAAKNIKGNENAMLRVRILEDGTFKLASFQEPKGLVK